MYIGLRVKYHVVVVTVVVCLFVCLLLSEFNKA